MTHLQPLFPRWNVAVKHLSSLTNPRGYGVAGQGPYRRVVAPTCLDSLRASYREHGKIIVDGRHSLMTIYGDPEVNYAFRAWHDAVHLLLGAEFNMTGEVRVCAAQQADVAKLYCRRDAHMFAHILFCEVVEQAEEFERTGRFPRDQRAFALARLPVSLVWELGE